MSNENLASARPPVPRRKVAWGTGAGFDESAPPRPRPDTSSPPPFGGDFPVFTDASASDTAVFHAGAQPQMEDAPSLATAPFPAAHVSPPPDPDSAGPVDLASVFEDFDITDEDPDLAAPAEASPSTGEVAFPRPFAAAGHATDAAPPEVGAQAAAPPQPLMAGATEPSHAIVREDAEPVDVVPAMADMTDVPTPATPEGPDPAEAGLGLEDLFGDDSFAAQTAVASASETTAEAGLSEQQALPLVPSTPNVTEVSHTAATSAAEEPVEPATPRPTRGFDLAARRQALQSARLVTAEDIAHDTPDRAAMRYTQAEYYYNVVDRILGLGRGGDPDLQAMIKRLELTRNKVLDAQQRREYQAMLEPRLATANIQLASVQERDDIFDIAYDELLGIGPLGPLWRDDTITEIMISGPDKVTIERDGRLERTPVRFRNLGHLEQTARTLAGISGDDRAVSATSPLVTIQLHRARVQFVWRPLAVNKVAISIRKFGDLMDMNDLLSRGALSEEMAAFLADAVTARATILVSGGTGSGKTTFINAVSEFIPDTERVITIEDALELQLRNTHVEALVTKEAASADDTMLFGQDQLLKASLRMRPDRIIVGEIRDGKGCSVMLEAANTGHDGTMTTVHANSPELALQRMATLLRRVENMPDDVAKAEVGTAINIVVQVVRKRGRRFVSHIALVDPKVARGGHGELATTLFSGDFPAEATVPVFSRVGSLRPDTELAIKLSDAGIDPAPWE